MHAELGQICQLSEENTRDRQALFHATSAQHQAFDEKIFPGISPSEERVQEIAAKLQELIDAEEWKDMWIAGGFMVAAFTVIGAGALCPLLPGVGCAFLSAALPWAGYGAGGAQLLLASREWDRKRRADAYEAQVRTMEDLGFAKTGSHSEVDRTWTWFAIEVIFGLSPIGVAARSSKVGTQIQWHTPLAANLETKKAKN